MKLNELIELVVRDVWNGAAAVGGTPHGDIELNVSLSDDGDVVTEGKAAVHVLAKVWVTERPNESSSPTREEGV